MSKTTIDNETSTLGGDLIWGVSAIAAEIGRDERQTFHLLEHEVDLDSLGE